MSITMKSFKTFKVGQIHHVLTMQESKDTLTFLKLENNLKSPEMTLGLHAVKELEKDIT